MPIRVTKLKPYAVAAATFLALWYGGGGSSASAQSGSVVQVSTEGELQQAVASIASDTMIVIAPGTYRLSSTLTINRPVTNVAIRGATDNANDVVLVGRGMDNASFDSVPHGISTGVNVVGVTIANLTIRDVYYHAIMLAPGTESPRIQNVRLIDAGRQFVKAYPDGKGGGVDDGLIERSVFEYSRTSRDSDTGGLEVNTGYRWAVRDNVFRNITAPTGQIAGPAVLFWNGSRDSVIERNTFINSQREIALGSQDRTPDDHTGGVVRNNVLYREPGIQGGQPAIYVADSPNTQILHNTILSNATATSLIQYRYRDTRGVVIRNNLLDGQIAARDQATGTVADNHTAAASSMFVNAAAGDLHLGSAVADVVDRAPVQALAGPDFDGENRPLGVAADFGADEYSASQVSTSTQASGSATTSSLTSTAASAPAPPGGVPRGPLPLPWQTVDIGSPATVGAAGWASGVFVGDGAGTDIGGSADQFRFIYQTLDGDGEVVARVDSLERTSPWAKAGVMIRDELTAGAKHASAMVTPNKNALFQRRIANDAIAAQTVTAGDIPVWLKIVRKGNAFTTFRSSNGTTWTQVGSEVVYLKRLVYVGLVVTSRSARSLSTATFSNVVVTPIASTSNQPPTVSLTAPDNGATYTAPATMTVSASATDTDGTIAAVEFYAGGTSIGSDATSPYSVTWTDAPAGTHSLTAVARDNAGATTTSSARQITISAPSNRMPAVTLTSPANGAAFNAPASIALSATASDSDGTITRVDFFAGTTKVGSDLSSPYSATWANAPAGNYAVTAVAVDNTGATVTSAAAQIAVTPPSNQPPAVSLSAPASGAKFTVPASITISATASDADGTIAKVEFYAGATLVGSATSAPFSVTWNGATVGPYTLSAKAFDNAGASIISSGVNITVEAAPGAPPEDWQSVDIGTASSAGATVRSVNDFRVTSSGYGIWGTADQFRYVYKRLTGDGEISACIPSLTFTTDWVKAGVMIRENLNDNSPHAFMLLSAGWGVYFQQRLVSGGESGTAGSAAGVAPHCVRLTRTGNQFNAYESVDGSQWTQVGTESIGMGQSVYVGLAVSSHNDAGPTTADFSRISIVGSTGGTTNQAPTVSITSPAAGTAYGTAPATMTLSANASDTDGSVTGVEFFAGSTLVGSDQSSPYSFSWSNVPAGSYTLTAVATDNGGARTTSAPVGITVAGSSNQLPNVALTTPANNATFAAPASVILAASASDPDGTVASVEFRSGSTILGTDTTNSYGMTWSNVPAGTYTITAVARDNSGATRTSAPITITVTGTTTPPPLPRSVVFTASADHDTSVTSYAVDFFAAGANPATATPVRTQNVGKPQPVAGDITVDITAAVQALPAGSYFTTVSAIGTGGSTRSTPSETFVR